MINRDLLQVSYYFWGAGKITSVAFRNEIPYNKKTFVPFLVC